MAQVIGWICVGLLALALLPSLAALWPVLVGVVIVRGAIFLLREN